MAKLKFDPARLLKGTDPLEMPTYGIPEAAHYLRMPTATLRSWVLGRTYQTNTGRKRFKPLIEIADREHCLLSFINLSEAHVLDACRRCHDIKMDKIRRAIDYVAKEFNSKHPLVDREFETNGVSLFVSKYGKLIDVSAEGQEVMRELVQEHLKRLERENDRIARLYPFTRPGADANSPRSVMIDPRISFGRPVLTSVRIPTAALAERYSAGESIDHLARDYGCERLDVEEAIRCEFRTADAAA